MSSNDIIRQLEREKAELWKVNARLQRKIDKLESGQKWTGDDAKKFVEALKSPAP